MLSADWKVPLAQRMGAARSSQAQLDFKSRSQGRELSGGRQGAGQQGQNLQLPCLLPVAELIYQGCHGEADDLNAAIIMALGLEVVVLPGVAPGHGARAVPAETQREQSTTWDQRERSSNTPGREPGLLSIQGCRTHSPWNVQKDKALGLQVLDLGGQVCPVALKTDKRRVRHPGWLKERGPAQPSYSGGNELPVAF